MAKFILLFLIIYLGGILETTAQYETKSLDLTSEVSGWYDEQIGLENTQLVVGMYEEYSRVSARHHPYFLEKKWISGDLKYRGEIFKHVNMLYNIIEDYLVVQHPTDGTLLDQPIKLNQDQVEWFVLDDFIFRNYGKKLSIYGNGFYNELFMGERLHFLVKRRKAIKLDYDKASPLTEHDDLYFLGYQGVFHEVSGKKEVIELFPGYKKEIKKYIRSNRLKIKKNNEGDWIRIVKYCDQLL